MTDVMYRGTAGRSFYLSADNKDTNGFGVLEGKEGRGVASKVEHAGHAEPTWTVSETNATHVMPLFTRISNNSKNLSSSGPFETTRVAPREQPRLS